MCLASTTGVSLVLAKGAAIGALLASLLGRQSPDTQSSSLDALGPVQSIGKLSRPEQSKLDLSARAVRVCNRQPDLTARYLAVHQTLAKGA